MYLRNLSGINLTMELANKIREKYYRIVKRNYTSLFITPITMKGHLQLFCIFVDDILFWEVGEEKLRKFIEEAKIEIHKEYIKELLKDFR